MTRSIRFVEAEDEENMVDKEQLSENRVVSLVKCRCEEKKVRES